MPVYTGEVLTQADLNLVVVTANTNIFATNLVPFSPMTTFVIYIVPQAAGVLSVFRTVSGVANNKAEIFNAGTSIGINNAASFSVPVGVNDTINMQFSVSTTLTQLKVVETP